MAIAIGILMVYAIASVVAFVLYAVDKSAAQDGRWRTPERKLHLAGLCCGWPGGLAAQVLLKHKNRKLTFQAVFWLTVALNVATVGGVCWLLFLRK